MAVVAKRLLLSALLLTATLSAQGGPAVILPGQGSIGQRLTIAAAFGIPARKKEACTAMQATPTWTQMKTVERKSALVGVAGRPLPGQILERDVTTNHGGHARTSPRNNTLSARDGPSGRFRSFFRSQE